MPKMRLPHPEELLPLDPRYPAALRALKDHGPIRVAGVLPELERAVAIVGTRRADPEALDFAHGLARDLASAGIVILSGGALGVDAAAHRGALAANGKTVAVLASGFAKPYPPSHGPLFEEIAASGALLTEAPDEGAFEGFRFLHRNRLIAALGHSGTIVIQAPIRSGTLSTAEDARRLKRPVWVVPGAPWDPRSQGGSGCSARGRGFAHRPEMSYRCSLRRPAMCGSGAPLRNKTPMISAVSMTLRASASPL
ncbi:MAG: DNA-processing protein DprA [Sandaracinaceae bacterium]|nr:DNA-processing protein DprA [Sandaracinaceae bacterium]